MIPIKCKKGYSMNILSIDLPIDLMNELNDIFEVSFIYGDNTEIIKIIL